MTWGKNMRWVVGLTIVSLLGACGGDSDDASTSLDVSAAEFEFSPSSYVIPAGTEVPLTFTNDGALLHEWVIMTTPIAEESEFTEDLVLWEEEAEAGETKEVTIPPLDAGTYQIICAIEGHFAAGMEGELVVAEG